MSSRSSLHRKRAPQDLENMFPLSKRRGSDMYQIRKRCPSDVATLLKGEFTRTTGETDRRKAAAMIPLIAAEHFAAVEAAGSGSPTINSAT